MQEQFWTAVEARIGERDLLCHPFYQAWSAGQLTQEDLREYATAYYHHVAAFPEYLRVLAARLEEGELRRQVLRNAEEEEGGGAADGRSHAELWLDFAAGFGAEREQVRGARPPEYVAELMRTFQRLATESPAGALAAYYAYESQVPRIADEKQRGLRRHYGADEGTCAYFDLHRVADVYHAQTWKQLLEGELTREGAEAAALAATEEAAGALWNTLDGIERERLARLQSVA